MLFGKAISYDSLTSSEIYPTDFCSTPTKKRFNSWNASSVGMHDHLRNIATRFAPDWLAYAFIALFGFPCSFLTQCEKHFSIFLFGQIVLTFLLKLYMSISINCILHEKIITLSSLAHGFFEYIKSKKVTDSHDAESDKRRRKKIQRTIDPPECSPKLIRWKI